MAAHFAQAAEKNIADKKNLFAGRGYLMARE